jgi:hypothetical protein
VGAVHPLTPPWLQAWVSLPNVKHHVAPTDFPLSIKHEILSYKKGLVACIFQASAAEMISALLWVITRRIMAIPYDVSG